MKLRTYINSTIYDATKDMVSAIDNSDIHIEHIIIVPDRFSLQMEKITLNLIKKSLFNVKVMGLTSLANEVFLRLHRKVEVLSSAESLLLTQRAIENVKKDFKTFRKCGINFCYEINKLISQIKSCQLKPLDLNDKADGISGAKYHDIMLIYDEYQKLLGNRLDANERLSLMINEIKENNIFKNTKFYFAQFDSFTKEGYSLIKTLIECAKEVNVSFANSISIGNDYIYEKDILYKLTEISKNLGIEIDSIVKNSQFDAHKDGIIRGVYSYQPVLVENNGFYSNISAQNINSEVEGLAKLVYYYTTKGYNYSDILVAVNDLGRYHDKIEREFDNYNIPNFIDTSITAEKTLLARTIIDILQYVSHGYQYQDLQNLCSNILINKSELIEIIQHYNIDNKFKYKKYIAKNFEFDNILEKLENSTCVNEFKFIIDSIVDLLSERLDIVLCKMEERAYLKEKSINEQIKDIIKEILNLIEKYSVNDINLSEFIKTFKLLLSFKEVSSVPTYVDSVMVGDATDSYFGDCKILIILGCQGLPKVSGDSGILNDHDISLNYINKKIEPTIRMINRRNRFKIFNLLSLPTERLVCFTRAFDDEGKKVEQPAFVDSLNKIFSQNTIRAEDVFTYNDQAIGNSFLIKLGCRKVFINENFHNLTDESALALDIRDIKRLTGKEKQENINCAQSLYFNKNKIFVTQLEQYFSCPFKHFITYGLKLKEKETEEFDARDTGNICHAGAELFVKELISKDFNNLDSINIDEFIEQNFYKIIRQENIEEKLNVVSERNSLIAFFKHQLNVLLSDILKEIKYSSFRPKLLEKQLDSITLGNKFKVEMSGKADRIDEYDNYFRIIDYKTGKTGSIVKELYYGEKLQLFLYQRVVKKMLNKDPAGVFYFNAKYDYDKAEQDKHLLLGLAENDEEILSLYDNDLSASSSIISLYKNKDGIIKGSAVAKERLSVYENYAFAIANKAVDEIESGYISPKPHERSCQYCKYNSICGFENTMGRRKLTKVDSFKEIKEDE